MHSSLVREGKQLSLTCTQGLQNSQSSESENGELPATSERACPGTRQYQDAL